jgi:glutamyl-Q tRNA(Asp) synthetase
MAILQPVFRFAPSPNGYLHLGHAYSALLNQRLAQESGGRLLLRIEDIDTIRCRPELIEAAMADLAWLGITWETPVLRQSEHFARYGLALETLQKQGLLYPCYCSRKALAARTAGGARDPDGALLYDGHCRSLSPAERMACEAAGETAALRLDMDKALKNIDKTRLFWEEFEVGPVAAAPQAWGDVVLARKETPTSYHLSVVLDDALQGVSDVVRGRDLYHATAIHRVLQEILALPQPRYRHHPLLTDAAGHKLAKSRASTPLRQLRQEGVTAVDIRHQLGFF